MALAGWQVRWIARLQVHADQLRKDKDSDGSTKNHRRLDGLVQVLPLASS